MRKGVMSTVCAAMMALLPASCGDTMSEYSTYPCRFVFNTATHAHSAALGSAVGGTGIFCKVTTVIKGGAWHYRFTTNQNMTDDVIFTAEDERVSVLLGMNNAIWFGYGNLDIPPVFYAYDAECPNCFNPNMVPVRSHPLSVASTGIATCGTCHREYNMNTGGNIVKGDKGSPLTRYHATYSPSGVVAVTN